MVLLPKLNCTLTQNSSLTENQFKEVINLFGICENFDHAKPKIYLDILKSKRNHHANFLFYIDSSQLIGFLSFFFFDEDCAEISAFVHPDYRHKGVFTSLFKSACKSISSLNTYKISFAILQKNTIAQQCAQSLNSHLTHYEYHMERYGDFLESFSEFDSTHKNAAFDYNTLHIKQAKSEDVQILAHIDAECFGSDYTTMFKRFQDTIAHSNREAWLCYNKDVCIGKAHILFNTNSVCIHDIGIIPHYQKHGYGTFLLKSIINYLIETKRCIKIQLEVTSHNESAIHLYKRCHFNITDIYAYWTFNIPVE